MRFSAVLEPLFPRTPVVPAALPGRMTQARQPQPEQQPADANRWPAHLAQLDLDQRVRQTGEW